MRLRVRRPRNWRAKLGRKFPAAAYHAGLDPDDARAGAAARSRVGKLACVLWRLIAFGMGDRQGGCEDGGALWRCRRAVEAYYQEIGRAGRDGLPSRTVLLYNFSDRKVQEFFLERNYPPKNDLTQVATLLTDEFVEMDWLQRKSKLDRETLDRVVEKLLAAGVATTDMSGAVRATGERGWQSGYDQQVAFRRDQIDRIVAFAEGTTCRMSALVRHFGERMEREVACGICDVCQPSDADGSAMRDASKRERDDLRTILRAVADRSMSSGKLFTELALTKDRNEFDRLLDGLARAALVTITKDVFRAPDGRDVTYRKVTVTHEGRTPDDETLATVTLRSSDRNTGPARRKKTVSAAEDSAALTPQQTELEKRLKQWRKDEAAGAGKPAFFIFGDAVLRAIAAAEPKTLSELGRVRGVGDGKLDAYGAAVLKVCRDDAGPELRAPAESLAKSSSRSAPGRRVAADVPREASHSPSRVHLKPKTVEAKAPTVSRPASTPDAVLSGAQEAVAARLREWRGLQAKSLGLPQFLIFSDSVLQGIVQAQPRSVAELEMIRGFGREKVERFGSDVLSLCRA